MKRVIIYCEGASEEKFINGILMPRLAESGVFIRATAFNGVSKYSIIRRELRNLCRSDRSAIVTTMLDYYGLPKDTPGYSESQGAFGDVYKTVEYVEKAIKKDIGEENCWPNILMHEYEALLFSDVSAFSYCDLSNRKISELESICEEYPTPEHINNSPDTAPSKRILKICTDYNKVLDGYNIAENIGLVKIRKRCKHFDAWLKCLENLG